MNTRKNRMIAGLISLLTYRQIYETLSKPRFPTTAMLIRLRFRKRIFECVDPTVIKRHWG